MVSLHTPCQPSQFTARRNIVRFSTYRPGRQSRYPTQPRVQVRRHTNRPCTGDRFAYQTGRPNPAQNGRRRTRAGVAAKGADTRAVLVTGEVDAGVLQGLARAFGEAGAARALGVDGSTFESWQRGDCAAKETVVRAQAKTVPGLLEIAGEATGLDSDKLPPGVTHRSRECAKIELEPGTAPELMTRFIAWLSDREPALSPITGRTGTAL